MAKQSLTKANGPEPDVLDQWVLQERTGGIQLPIGSAVNLVLTADTIYWIYCGRAANRIIPAFVNFWVASAGSGAQEAEVGWGVANAPNGSNQSITCIAATSTITDLTGTGRKRNTAAFTTPIDVGLARYMAIRTNMAGAEPTCNAFSRDYARGYLLTTATGGVLTVGTVYTGTIITASTSTNEAPVAWPTQE